MEVSLDNWSGVEWGGGVVMVVCPSQPDVCVPFHSQSQIHSIPLMPVILFPFIILYSLCYSPILYSQYSSTYHIP